MKAAATGTDGLRRLIFDRRDFRRDKIGLVQPGSKDAGWTTGKRERLGSIVPLRQDAV